MHFHWNFPHTKLNLISLHIIQGDQQSFLLQKVRGVSLIIPFQKITLNDFVCSLLVFTQKPLQDEILITSLCIYF